MTVRKERYMINDQNKKKRHKIRKKDKSDELWKAHEL